VAQIVNTIIMNVECPNCHHQYSLDAVMDEKKQQEIKMELALEMEKNEEERKTYYRNLMELEKQNLIEANQKVVEQEKLELQKKQEAKLLFLEEENKKAELLLADARKAELTVLQLQQEIKINNENNALEIQKALLVQQETLREQLKQELLGKKEEEHLLQLKDRDHKLQELTRTINDLKKRSEQGSMQSQGEGMEKLLEETLQVSFPMDTITEVEKGVRGADCLQSIKNNSGQTIGSIIFESKRAQNWANDWIDKLKTDQRNAKADMAVLVTQVFPRDMNRFGLKDGVWVCNFKDIIGVVSILRQGILRTNMALRSQENKGDKAVELYDYLTSLEFKQHIEAILEGQNALLLGLKNERDAMERIWKQREKQILQISKNTSGLYGSIQGIAGGSINNVPLLEMGDADE
jgi:hypothetical protein